MVPDDNVWRVCARDHATVTAPVETRRPKRLHTLPTFPKPSADDSAKTAHATSSGREDQPVCGVARAAADRVRAEDFSAGGCALRLRRVFIFGLQQLVLHSSAVVGTRVKPDAARRGCFFWQ